MMMQTASEFQPMEARTLKTRMEIAVAKAKKFYLDKNRLYGMFINMDPQAVENEAEKIQQIAQETKALFGALKNLLDDFDKMPGDSLEEKTIFSEEDRDYLSGEISRLSDDLYVLKNSLQELLPQATQV